jgi:hypothetical protein
MHRILQLVLVFTLCWFGCKQQKGLTYLKDYSIRYATLSSEVETADSVVYLIASATEIPGQAGEKYQLIMLEDTETGDSVDVWVEPMLNTFHISNKRYKADGPLMVTRVNTTTLIDDGTEMVFDSSNFVKGSCIRYFNSEKLTQIPFPLEDSTLIWAEVNNGQMSFYLTKNLSLTKRLEGEAETSQYVLKYIDTTGRVKSAYELNASWVENDEKGYSDRMHLLSRPYYYLQDIDHDGQEELLLKDRRHNGTMWNAACMHIFSLKGGEIKYLGNFEYISHMPIEDQFLVRHWNIETGMVTVFQKPEPNSNDSILFGSFQLAIKNDTLVVTDKQIDGGWDGPLVSMEP